MTNVRALTQVRQDLAAGRRSAAVRRLRAMLAANPGDLEVYRMLTEIHRNAGDSTEAGRWGYLSGDATPEEIAAFERAHPQPWVRLRLLGKSLDPAKLPNAAARARLADLHRQVNEATIPIQHQRKATGSGGGDLTELPTQPIPGSGQRTVAIPSQRRTTTTPRRGPTGPAGPAGALTSQAPSRGSGMAAGVLGAVRRAARRPSGQTVSPDAETTQPIRPTGAAEPTQPIRPTGAAEPTQPIRPTGAAVPAQRDARAASPVPAPTPGRVARSTPSTPTASSKPSMLRRRSLLGSEPMRNYLVLALLIVIGLIGSIASVGGVRAIFGVRNWLSPVQAIIDAISGIVN